MNNEFRNSITLIGNVSKIGSEFTTKNGSKMKFFDIGQGNKYKNEDGEEVNNSQYFTIRLNEESLNKYDFLEVGKPVHITGHLKSYINKNKLREVIVVPSVIRDLSKIKDKESIELFDYDWLNDDDSEEIEANGL